MTKKISLESVLEEIKRNLGEEIVSEVVVRGPPPGGRARPSGALSRPATSAPQSNFSTNNDSPYGFARSGSDEDTPANFFASSQRMMQAQRAQQSSPAPSAAAPSRPAVSAPRPTGTSTPKPTTPTPAPAPTQLGSPEGKAAAQGSMTRGQERGQEIERQLKAADAAEKAGTVQRLGDPNLRSNDSTPIKPQTTAPNIEKSGEIRDPGTGEKVGTRNPGTGDVEDSEEMKKVRPFMPNDFDRSEAEAGRNMTRNMQEEKNFDQFVKKFIKEQR